MKVLCLRWESVLLLFACTGTIIYCPAQADEPPTPTPPPTQTQAPSQAEPKPPAPKDPKQPAPAPAPPKPIKVNCTDQTLFQNSTPISIAQLEVYVKSLRSIDQLHHTDKCDPHLDDQIHSELWAIEKIESLTFGHLHSLKCGMQKTCPGGRNMMCDPTRKRCVCKPNSFWLPLSKTELLDPQLNMNRGRCYLKVGSKCEDQSKVLKKMEQLVCVEHSLCKPVKVSMHDNKTETRCNCKRFSRVFTNTTNQTIQVRNEECWNAMNRQEVQLAGLIKTAKEMRWRTYGETCTNKDAVDTRVHTLRSIDVKLNREWADKELDHKYQNGSSQRCNFAKNLNCNKSNQCDCKPFYSWNLTTNKNGEKEYSCVGQEGAFCEMRFWAEADTVGTPTKCNEGLTCIVTTHPDTLKEYHVCCFIGNNAYRKSLTYSDYHMCQLDGSMEGYEDATDTFHKDNITDIYDEYGDLLNKVDVSSSGSGLILIVPLYFITALLSLQYI